MTDVDDTRSYESLSLVGKFARLVCPWRIGNWKGKRFRYPGRIGVMKRLTGYSTARLEDVLTRAGNRKLSLNLASILYDECKEREAAFGRLASELEKHMAELIKARKNKPRPGMWEVRVRDASGIPRNAAGKYNGNAPGFEKPPTLRVRQPKTPSTDN